MSAAEELEVDDQDQSAEEVWGDRAQQLVEFVKSQKPPVAKLQTVIVFARRKGWEHPTLTGVLEYCEKQKLLASYKSIHGAAWKIPLTPVFDVADGDAAPKVAAAPNGCICVRTAPNVNYGCRVHGGARLKKTIVKETSDMAKEWVSTKEAAELLGLSKPRVLTLARDGALKSRKLGDHQRSPMEFERASLVAYRPRGHADMLDEPKAKTKPAKSTKLIKAPKAEKPAATQTMRRASKPAGGGQSIVVEPALREDVIMLVRLVDRGWMSQDQAFGKLRELAESL